MKQGPSSKPDFRLALGYGSAWHLLRMLGWHRAWFGQQIRTAIGASDIEWLDFPAKRQVSSYPGGIPIRDGEWERIDFITDEPLREKFDLYWPRKGTSPNWDAIGRATIAGESTWILVEAKAHLSEVNHNGTTAKESGGRPMIRLAFVETLRDLGHSEVDAVVRAEVWLKGFYQHANRLATLHFLLREGIPAQLVFVYFCGDQHPTEKQCPSSPLQWGPLLKKIHEELGLTNKSALEARVHEVFVDVNAG